MSEYYNPCKHPRDKVTVVRTGADDGGPYTIFRCNVCGTEFMVRHRP